ncbi:hypothetical protein [Altericroceibacterium xinjiangense]|uniref:hypothetical protein n=1 Tax=Altericroceibacterium xinjiangense TaxID=762261 RepID=UPI000F7F32CF|nr:hypothetical protein [Altericroceibacterium xinjiangense]
MRKIVLPTVVAGTLLLGGCASGMGGDPLGAILGSVLGGSGLGGSVLGGASNQTSGNEFERAAVNACGQQASQYGRVSIANVQQSRDSVRVDGRIAGNDRYERQFTCTFRSDGQIVDFRTT